MPKYQKKTSKVDNYLYQGNVPELFEFLGVAQNNCIFSYNKGRIERIFYYPNPEKYPQLLTDGTTDGLTVPVNYQVLKNEDNKFTVHDNSKFSTDFEQVPELPPEVNK